MKNQSIAKGGMSSLLNKSSNDPIQWNEYSPYFGNEYYIYSLTNPIDGTIFYIGRTRNADLRVRLVQHICNTKVKNKQFVAKIQEILKAGIVPQIKLIEQVERPERETEIISKMRDKHPLLNILKGANSYKRDSITKARIKH